jgi:cyclase
VAEESFVALGDRVSYWQGDLGAHEQTNVGIVRTGESIVVIDANFAWAAERILASIRSQYGEPVTHVVNTHYHVDHSLGNSVYANAGITIVGAEGQRRELIEKGPHDAIVQTGEVPERFYPPTLEFTGRITFYEPTLHLTSVGPAHSAADVVAWLPDDGVLFVGDLAVAWDHGNNFSDDDADIERWIGVLDDCIALEPRVVIPAHGRLSHVADLIEQRDFMRELWDGARAVAGGASESELRTGAVAERLIARYPDYAVDARRFEEMAGSMLEAARKVG